MGTGKSVSTLTALDTLSLAEDIYPVLIIAPLIVARDTWPDEARKWEHLRHIDVMPILGTEAERLTALRYKVDIYTINFENIEWLVEHFGERWPFRTVVVDESRKLKSFRLRQGGKRTAALAKVAHTKIKRMIQLTGAPAPNGLGDLWGQAWFIDAGQRLGRTYSAFTQRWFQRSHDGFGVTPLPFAQEQIQGALADVCLRIDASDWFDLEEPVHMPQYVALPPKARIKYREMEKEMLTQIDDRTAEAFNAAARTQKCLQLCNGAIYVDPLVEGEETPGPKEWREVHDMKLEALKSIVEEANGSPVLVAYHFKSDLARLRKAFPAARVLSDPAQLREFKTGRYEVGLGHPACLHPATKVLTERKGWVNIVDVGLDDRVFDGVEFVSHAGCSYSGYKEVIEVLGITMTPEHKLLIGGEWVEAIDVRDNPEIRKEALHLGRETAHVSASTVFDLRGRVRTALSKRDEEQPGGPPALRDLHQLHFSPDDEHPYMVHLAGDEMARTRSDRPQLRREGDHRLRGVARLSKLLQRHARRLFGRADSRTHRREQALLERKLQVGEQHGAASQQAQQPLLGLPGGADTPRRTMPSYRNKQDEAGNAAEQGDVSGRSSGGRGAVPLREEYKADKRETPRKSHVYDLVNCGPRHRFVIRNNLGEVYISHNSMGHGVDGLQEHCHRIAFFGHWWDMDQRDQIIGRVGPVRQFQAGHKRPVYIYDIIARDTVDELVLARHETKRDVQDLLLEAMKGRRTK